jgi:hypothetical protein
VPRSVGVSCLDATNPAPSILSNIACTLRSACGPFHIGENYLERLPFSTPGRLQTLPQKFPADRVEH